MNSLVSVYFTNALKILSLPLLGDPVLQSCLPSILSSSLRASLREEMLSFVQTREVPDADHIRGSKEMQDSGSHKVPVVYVCTYGTFVHMVLFVENLLVRSRSLSRSTSS